MLRCHCAVQSRNLLEPLPAGRDAEQLADDGGDTQSSLMYSTCPQGCAKAPNQSKVLHCLYRIVKNIPPWGKGLTK